ncbi:hypothetical protein TUM22923_01320 [Polynucleobacter sp. TUM22923]|jgi:fluoride ion exporter CrcB/FEX|uniref:hypothetical protein n=1 Tax=Polynucleobacter sp. TUM22923 TaxID=3022126 RepID=UPI002572DA05|nr:hypothetical protein [Polynucleobacter sp. TUM22923]BDX20811.1 hypothetical protein TUM22923_01320 [Polynucleobacter sp. TUM22923]
MGVAMGFLAFLLIGSVSGLFAWVSYPRPRSLKLSRQKLLWAALIGFLAAFASSFAGQWTGFFQSGQILEWLSAIVAASLSGYLYAVIAR